ncbi:MAG: hypothetical protein Q8M83_00355 [bacterium]|nr:hypothetical protein [bacterium]
MSAHSVVGIPYDIAEKLDAFWKELSLEHRAALHIAYNLSTKQPTIINDANTCMWNAESGRSSVSNVRCDFLRFLENRVETCPTMLSMMTAILEWGQLDWEGQKAAMGWICK